METISELITAHAVYSTRDSLAIVALFSVTYRNSLEQRDIPTIDVGCAILFFCKYWGATALKYTVAMCLMKYYLDTLEYEV